MARPHPSANGLSCAPIRSIDGRCMRGGAAQRSEARAGGNLVVRHAQVCVLHEELGFFMRLRVVADVRNESWRQRLGRKHRRRSTESHDWHHRHRRRADARRH